MFSNRQDRKSFVKRLARSKWPDLFAWAMVGVVAAIITLALLNCWAYSETGSTSVGASDHTGAAMVTSRPIAAYTPKGDIPVIVSTQNGDITTTVDPSKGDIRVTVTGDPVALCGDGTYSYAAHHQGAAFFEGRSGHHGVSQWLN